MERGEWSIFHSKGFGITKPEQKAYILQSRMDLVRVEE